MAVEAPIQGLGNGFVILGRSTLTAVGDTMPITIPPGYTFLRVYVNAIQSGSIQACLHFNGDTAANYSYRRSADGGADGTSGGSNQLALQAAASHSAFAVVDILNLATQEKLAIAQCTKVGTAGAANVGNRYELTGKWANTTDLITSVNVFNLSTGDFAAGSSAIVLGML